jgi:hypothetical protein
VQTKTVEPGQKTTLSRYLATVWRYGEQDHGPSLNDAVTGFVQSHPEWGHGKGTP